MKKRGLFFMVILTFITLGIYNLYWLVNTKKEMRAKGQKIPPLSIVLLPTVGIALGFILLYQLAGNNSSGSTESIAVILIAMAGVVAFVGSWLYWLYKYCKAAEVITNKNLSFEFNYLMGVLLSIAYGPLFIWTLIVQNSFNKIPPAVTAYAGATPQPVNTPVVPAAPVQPVPQPAQPIQPATQQPPQQTPLPPYPPTEKY